MEKNYKGRFEHFTPQRILDNYSDRNDEIVVSNGRGIDLVSLTGAGRRLWLLLDGKHNTRQIADILCEEFSIEDSEGMLSEVKILLLALQKKNLVIVNWDPLYKLSLPQELN